MNDSTPPPDFEAALSELGEVVSTLEKGELSLDASLQSFERGIKLSRQCESALKDAEKRINLLMHDTNSTADAHTPPDEE